MFKNTLIPLVTGAILALTPSAGIAQNFLSLDDIANVTMLPGWRTETGTHMAAIRIELAPGWKTYWRSAGAGGIAPRLDWSGSENLENVDVHWPIPTVFDPDAARSYGYTGTVVVPIELTPGHAVDGTISVRGQMDIGVCELVCIPMSVILEAELPNSGQRDPAIKASLANRPVAAETAGLRSAKCSVEPISDGLRISAELNLPDQGGDEVVVIELPDQSIWIAETQSVRKGRYLKAVTDLVPANAAPFLLTRSDIRMTVFGSNGTVNIQGCTAG